MRTRSAPAKSGTFRPEQNRSRSNRGAKYACSAHTFRSEAGPVPLCYIQVVRILVIDDDVELCALMSELLKRENYVVECQHEGRRGLERALSGQDDLLVLDVMLPGIDGFE